MGSIPKILLHHPESVDPTLVEWLQHKIDDVLGLEPLAIVLLILAIIVLFPVGLFSFMWYQRRRAMRSAE